MLTLRNDEITLKGARNALLPTFDVYGYLTGQGVGRLAESECCNCLCYGGHVPARTPDHGYGTALQNAFNSSAPDKGIGFNLTIPIRNRYAQSVQERSLMEYRQAELRLEQLYTQIRMQVVNAKFALTNDRAQVQAGHRGPGLQAAEPGCGDEEAAAWVLPPRRMCCCSSAIWPSPKTT